MSERQLDGGTTGLEHNWVQPGSHDESSSPGLIVLVEHEKPANTGQTNGSDRRWLWSLSLSVGLRPQPLNIA